MGGFMSRKVEEIEAVRMSYCGWVGGWVTFSAGRVALLSCQGETRFGSEEKRVGGKERTFSAERVARLSCQGETRFGSEEKRNACRASWWAAVWRGVGGWAGPIGGEEEAEEEEGEEVGGWVGGRAVSKSLRISFS